MELESLYREIILDHYRKPRNHGRLEHADAEVHHTNPICGDEMTLQLRLEDGRIAEVGFVGIGCAISQAAASVATDLVKGLTVEQAEARIEAFRLLMHGETEADEEILGDAIAFEGVAKFPARVKCALLGWMALKDALARAAGGKEER
ncbi:MAG: SUF system NifU family Fe-S cluster assembly protein [Actinomycetota bacterium]